MFYFCKLGNGWFFHFRIGVVKPQLLKIWVVWFSMCWFSLHDIHNLYVSSVVRCSSRPVVQALRSSSWHSEFWVPLLPHAAAEMPVKTWLLVFRCYKQYLPCSGLKFSLLFAYFSCFCNSTLTCDFCSVVSDDLFV